MNTCRLSTRLLAALVCAVVAMGVVVVTATSASAAERSRQTVAHHAKKPVTKHPKKPVKKKKKPVKHHPKKRAPKIPSCTGISSVGAEVVWFDHRGDNANYLSRLICGAADRSTVRIKMFFIVDNPGPAARFLRDVELMHRYHHVHVQILVDYKAQRGLAGSLKQDERVTPGVSWYGCFGGCESSVSSSITHSKFIAISKLRRTGRPALFTTSTNVGEQQLVKTVQSGILFTDNTSLYGRFTQEFTRYLSCAQHRACNRAPAARLWQTYGSVSVYFSPDTVNLIATDLRQLDCTHGGQIDVVSLMVDSYSTLMALLYDQKQGCAVHVIIEHPELATGQVRELGARVMTQHDKYLVIDTPSVHRVYAGTQDFSTPALKNNDNYMLRTSTNYIYQRYCSEFRWQWKHTVAMNSSKARAISRATHSMYD